MAAIFACIVQPKVIEFNVADQKLHRAQKDEELRLEIEALSLLGGAAAHEGIAAAGRADAAGSADPGVILCQPGGACRLLSRDSSVSVATVGSAVCVFEGTLTNAEALAEAYSPLPEDEPSPQAAAFSGAELMCHMYGKVGVEMLGLLRGTFTFVLYESKTSRVLAARDGSGWCPLFQARTARSESLILSNSRELLEACSSHDILEFLPGDYKYGWSATPRRYQPADHAKLSRRSLDLVSSPHHHSNHHGQHFGQPPSRGGSRRTSLDHHDAGAGAGAGAGKPRRKSMDHGHSGGHAGGNGARGGQGSPQQQQPAPPPHRTYVVSAEDPRIIKATPTPTRPQQTAATTAAATAAAAGPSPAASSTQVAGAASPGPQDKVAGAGATASRGGSARGAASGHHNRRRSMDNHGAWRLGAGQAVPGAGAKAGAATQSSQQRTQPQQPQGAKQHQGPRLEAGDSGCGGDGKQQGTPGSAGKRRGGGGGGGAGREGQHGFGARTPPKPQQPPVAESTAAASDGSPRADPDPANLRVEAAPFTPPPWVASAPGAAAAVAVGGSP